MSQLRFYTHENAIPRPYSTLVRAGDFLFTSGHVPHNEQRQVIGNNIEEQTHQVFKNLIKTLKLADCGLEDVCKVTVWLDDAQDFANFNKVYSEYFANHKPVRSTVESKLMIDAKVEIELTVYKPA